MRELRVKNNVDQLSLEAKKEKICVANRKNAANRRKNKKPSVFSNFNIFFFLVVIWD